MRYAAPRRRPAGASPATTAAKPRTHRHARRCVPAHAPTRCRRTRREFRSRSRQPERSPRRL